MKKTKVTYKHIRDNYSTIIRLGYCDLQGLLKYYEPFAYSSGIYGWNCDYYNIDGIIISTGYRPIGNVAVDYATIQDYNNAVNNHITYDMTYEEKKKEADKLIKDLFYQLGL